mgnify:CR=1 FL=1
MQTLKIMNNTDVTVILPVHETNEKINEWFDKAVKSIVQSKIKPGKVLVVASNDKTLKSFLESWEQPEELDITISYNDGLSDFCSQINYGVSICETEFFSILECDDEYSNVWFKQFNEYVEAYSEVDIFLPLVVDTDENGQFLGFTNESLWAMGFSEELGYLDNPTLLRYQNFQTSGMIMRKDKFDEIGGLKPSFKLTFTYEFLLRATYNDAVILTIPKVGYKHTNQRINSLFWDYKFDTEQQLKTDEAKFWIEAAKKEYFFTMDRELVFEEN